jgi:hypothetical protein
MCIDSSNPRMDTSLESTLRVFIDSFGEKLVWSNLGIILTKWSFSEESIKKRNKNKDSEQ